MEYSVTFYGTDLQDLTQTIEFNLRQLRIATVAIGTMSSTYSQRSHRSNRYGDTRSVYSIDYSTSDRSVRSTSPPPTSRRGSSYSQQSGPSYVPAYHPTNASNYNGWSSSVGRSHRSGGSRSSSRLSRSDRTDTPEDRQRVNRNPRTSYASSERYIGGGNYPDSNASYTSRDIVRRRVDYTGSEVGSQMDDRSSYRSSRSSRSTATRSRWESDDRSTYSSSCTSDDTATFSPLEQKNDRARHGEREYDADAGYNVEIRRPPGDVRRG